MKNIKTFEDYFVSQTFKQYLDNNIINKFDIVLDCPIECLIDLDGIDIFDNIERLIVNNNHLTSLEPIKNLTKLTYLDFSRNKISSLKDIKNLFNLKLVALSRNLLTNLNGIENLINLTNVYCYNNKITSLEPIENLTKLIMINCSHNEITSLKPIENLTKLEAIYCGSNPIDWVDYIDKDGRTYYIKLPKSITLLSCDKFENIKEYWEFMDKNQPSGISRKFNF